MFILTSNIVKIELKKGKKILKTVSNVSSSWMNSSDQLK